MKILTETNKSYPVTILRLEGFYRQQVIMSKEENIAVFGDTMRFCLSDRGIFIVDNTKTVISVFG